MKRLVVVAAMILASFFASYAFASARQSADTSPGSANLVQYQPQAQTGSSAGGGCGGGCCGGGGAPVEGSATVEGDVQKLNIDTSAGSFNPNVIKARAGVPVELTFSQAPGGCMSGVMFPDFGITEDLTGGEKTIRLPALNAGEYQFFCQMQMVSAKLVVE